MTAQITSDAIVKKYEKMNRVSQNNAIVFFGSTLFSEMPVCVLTESMNLNEPVYNRSIVNMSIFHAENFLKQCIFDLNPGKVFVEIGEEDLTESQFDTDEFILKYEWLLYSINRESNAKIHVISTWGKNSSAVNERLKTLCRECGCEYIDISDLYGSDDFEMKLMNRLKHYLRSGKIDFFDAMQ